MQTNQTIPRRGDTSVGIWNSCNAAALKPVANPTTKTRRANERRRAASSCRATNSCSTNCFSSGVSWCCILLPEAGLTLTRGQAWQPWKLFLLLQQIADFLEEHFRARRGCGGGLLVPAQAVDAFDEDENRDRDDEKIDH